MKHNDFKAKLLSRPEVKQAYEELETEFREWDEKLKSRRLSDNKALNADPQRRDENLVVK